MSSATKKPSCGSRWVKELNHSQEYVRYENNEVILIDYHFGAAAFDRFRKFLQVFDGTCSRLIDSAL